MTFEHIILALAIAGWCERDRSISRAEYRALHAVTWYMWAEGRFGNGSAST